LLASSFCKLSSLKFAKLANSIPTLSSCRSVFTVKISLNQGRLGSKQVKSQDKDMKGREFRIRSVTTNYLLGSVDEASFNRVDRVCGLSGSLNYDSNGNWLSVLCG
jgi:hypothetical protein